MKSVVIGLASAMGVLAVTAIVLMALLGQDEGEGAVSIAAASLMMSFVFLFLICFALALAGIALVRKV